MRSMHCAPIAIGLLLAAPSLAANCSNLFVQQAHVSIQTTASGCGTNPGPFVTLDGTMQLSGLNVRIILTEDDAFTRVGSADFVTEVPLIPVGRQISIHQQPAQGGAGGNPYVYLQFHDAKAHDLSSLQLLGRCVQGFPPAALGFLLS